MVRKLADRFGILPEYLDATGRHRRITTNATRMALLSAMGVEAATERAARDALRVLDDAERNAILSPVRVVRNSAAALTTLSAVAPIACKSNGAWRIDLCTETGGKHIVEGRTTRWRSGGLLRLPLPVRPGLGYHRVELVLRLGKREWSAVQTLIVVPDKCPSVVDILGSPQGFGICTNLYTMRTRRNWGVGDFTDLSDLCRWGSGYGASFVGINPLHALTNAGTDVCPYSPFSRLYRNSLYLDVAAVPEFAECSAARTLLASPHFRKMLEELRVGTRVQYHRVNAAKTLVLQILYRYFRERHGGGDSARAKGFRQYVHTEGNELIQFATFGALQSHASTRGRRALDWRRWPAGLRDPMSPEVNAFRQAHADRVDFHCYVQFELDRQLEAVAKKARDRGMAIGLYQDLALGSSPAGSDAWANQSLFACNATLGAPPDEYAREGQDWRLQPIVPQRWAASQYRFWMQLVRKALAHSGALRIDHAMGLQRQFWIPAGASPTDGAYVRYPRDDLMGIVALEAHRRRALVIGEDLGTVPPGFSKWLARWGVLSSRVLYFERSKKGTFRSASRLSRRALVTIATHDHAPLAGYLQGHDLALRKKAGAIAAGRAFVKVMQRRRIDCQALTSKLVAARLLSTRGREPTAAEVCAAVHAFLCRSSAPLVGLMLDDLALETEPVNLPGVGSDRYPNWQRRMSKSLAELAADPFVRRQLGDAGRHRGAAGPRQL